jgi:hypothetical protein
MKSLIQILEENFKVEKGVFKSTPTSKEVTLTKVEEILTNLDDLAVKGIIVPSKFWSDHVEEIHFLMVGEDSENIKEQNSDVKTSKSLIFTYKDKPVYSLALLPLSEFTFKFKDVKPLTASMVLLDSAVLS